MKSIEVCQEIMKSIIEKGFTNQIHKRELEKVIIVLRGVDKRTIKNWVRTLEVMEFIKPVNSFVFELNFKKCPELLNRLIENGQKKLM